MNDQPMETIARQALQGRWGVSTLSLTCAADEEGRRCFEAVTDRGQLFVKIQEGQGEYFDDIVQGMRVQEHLRQQGLRVRLPSVRT